MAKDLHIPVVTCSQLNRSTDARGKAHRPQMSDLRESGSIEQDADIILMLYREGYYESDGKDDDKAAELNAAMDNKAQVLVVKTDTAQRATLTLTGRRNLLYSHLWRL